VDEHGRPVLRQDLTRARFETFLGKSSPTEIVLEACGSSHHWGRVAQALGHTVRLIPPQYVKPFVKRGKNNRDDAEAIGEAASRPTMRCVPVKSAETQAEAMDLSARDLLVRQRTQLVNAVRGHAAEFGVIGAKGIAQVEPLLKRAAASDMPQAAKETLAQLGRVIAQLDAQLAEIGQRLAAIPGVGPLTALTVAMQVDAGQFESARHFAAWLGLTPKEQSTGSRQSLGGISRAGNERLRQLLVVGAMAVIRHAKPEARRPAPGCCNCWSADRAKWRRSLWPTRWPAPCGP
jgi:transposase